VNLLERINYEESAIEDEIIAVKDLNTNSGINWTIEV
jgi:hypothetical protein